MDAGLVYHANSYGAKAEEDMINAEAVIPLRIGTPRGGAFWCEQAIEKYFKHILVQNDVQGDLTMRHKLLPLAADAGFNCSASERYILRELGRMYYERYPSPIGEGISEDPTWSEVDEIYALAKRVQSWAYTLIKRRSSSTKSSLRQMNLE